MRKRSSYKPRPVRYDNMSWVRAGLMSVGEVPEAGVALKLVNMQAMDMLIRGEGTGSHSHILREAFNVAIILPRMNPKLGTDWLPELQEAKAAANAAHARGERTGSYVFTGPEMQAVRHGMEIHNQQVDECTVHEMERAIAFLLASKAAIRAAAEQVAA